MPVERKKWSEEVKPVSLGQRGIRYEWLRQRWVAHCWAASGHTDSMAGGSLMTDSEGGHTTRLCR